MKSGNTIATVIMERGAAGSTRSLMSKKTS